MAAAHHDDDADIPDAQFADRVRDVAPDPVTARRRRLDLAQARFGETAMRVIAHAADRASRMLIAHGAGEDGERTAVDRSRRGEPFRKIQGAISQTRPIAHRHFNPR